ncbi:37 kDa salivary gland allergen Aed a 2-like isoform X1 [Anopheles darlingi]|uniref:Putative 37 kDa salivary gland allergen aed a 2 n=1 Tax=Anopheles darlingi TaxID=43151 RepID=A0A2M4DQE7_ANODA|nr:37 kDa salivary gland allergen Aed a 2-like isoform X1 [Anopheles darlingi]XP_049530104.1 37 kDa salivary gland allergen Aed a 2-like isoform X1 [Anopheles darlingi]
MQFMLLLIPPLLLVLIRTGSGDRRGKFESAGDHLSPDDTLFVHLRCFELFAAASDDQSSDRERDASDWLLATNSSYMRKTDRSPDFLNCVLTKLQLYDDHHQMFKTLILTNQHRTYGNWMNLSVESVQSFSDDLYRAVVQSSASESLFAAFEPVFHRHQNTFFQLFLRDPIVLDNWYRQKGSDERNPNKTVVDFCEHHMSEELRSDICLIRSYQISNRTTEMEKHIDCIFRGFRYITSSGLIDVSEILRDYQLVSSLNDTILTHVRDCSDNYASIEVPVIKRSLQMYTCLLEGTLADAFKEAFDYREIRSGNLSHMLHKLPYNREQTKLQILALDKARCDDQQTQTGRHNSA